MTHPDTIKVKQLVNSYLHPMDIEWQRTHGILFIGEQDGICRIACENPQNEWLLATVRLRCQKPVQAVAASLAELRKHWGEAQNHTVLEEDDPLQDLDSESLRQNQDASWESKPVLRLVQSIIDNALREQATDIHLEADESELRVRFRKDGMLRLHRNLPQWVKTAVVNRIKVMANLDIAEKRLPQDGRATWDYKGGEVDMRISTLPTRFGEKCVLRLLRQSKTLQRLDNLGLPEPMREKLEYFFHRPQGMIFVTGPTGSGKTSTLYAGLQHILNREINITTLEDPIEYELPGANQVQIHDKAGLTFAEALRSILRQDPDVILVGEIRDSETARIAVQAAQTGHLVLSTLHTNDSVSALTRLKDLGIEPFLIGNAVLTILAQRLVRRLCPKCLQWQEPTPEQKRVLPHLPSLVPHAQGCEYCSNSGYRGRLAVFEMLSMNHQVRELILAGAPESDLRKASAWEPMLVDGIEKMKSGSTSPDELIRVLLTEASF